MKEYEIEDNEMKWAHRMKEEMPNFITNDIDLFHRKNFTNFFVSINYNREMKDGNKALSQIHQRIDRKLLGTRYYLKPATDRTFFIYFQERTKNNHIHYHLLWSVPTDNDKAKRFEYMLAGIVKKVCRSDTPQTDIQTPVSVKNIKSVVKYMTKDIWKNDNMKTFGMSSLFHPWTEGMKKVC